ncbi:Uncharacterised protein [Mycobacteroides abscessus subsp. massiliense]|nr:Uncharacterised protein [Mycobacteroides abscessus subsp. massiliense]
MVGNIASAVSLFCSNVWDWRRILRSSFLLLAMSSRTLALALAITGITEVSDRAVFSSAITLLIRVGSRSLNSRVAATICSPKVPDTVLSSAMICWLSTSIGPLSLLGLIDRYDSPKTERLSIRNSLSTGSCSESGYQNRTETPSAAACTPATSPTGTPRSSTRECGTSPLASRTTSVASIRFLVVLNQEMPCCQ